MLVFYSNFLTIFWSHYPESYIVPINTYCSFVCLGVSMYWILGVSMYRIWKQIQIPGTKKSFFSGTSILNLNINMDNL